MSYLNIPYSETLTYQGHGRFIRHCCYDPIRGMIKGKVNETRTHVVANGTEYKLKNGSYRNMIPGNELFSLPLKRKFQGEYWAKNTVPADDLERFRKTTWDASLKPQPMSGGLLIAKSPTKNVDYLPGPGGGTSFGRQTNIWARTVIVLWDDGSLEEFYQEWCVNKKPSFCSRGAGRHLTEKEMLTRIMNGKLFPFTQDPPRIPLP